MSISERLNELQECIEIEFDTTLATKWGNRRIKYDQDADECIWLKAALDLIENQISILEREENEQSSQQD